MRESYFGLLVYAERAERAHELREWVLTALPAASVAVADSETIAEGELPAVDAAVIDVGRGERGAVDAFRALRARGFPGRVVLVVEATEEEAASRAVNALGNAVCLARGEVASRPLRLAEEVAAVNGRLGADDSPAAKALSRTRRVIAAGELALRLQHDINNPLAGLLAEVQLLQLDDLTPDQRAATDRILALCRRIVVLVRRLDALAETADGKVVKL